MVIIFNQYFNIFCCFYLCRFLMIFLVHWEWPWPPDLWLTSITMGQKKPRPKQSSPGRGAVKPDQNSSGRKSHNSTSSKSGSDTPPAGSFGLPHFAIGLLAGLLVPSLLYLWQHLDSLPQIPSFSTPPSNLEEFESPSLPDYLKASLFEPFSVDYNAVLKVREQNMQKYSYNYSRNGVDKRSGLSLQEYWDVYDGKW